MLHRFFVLSAPAIGLCLFRARYERDVVGKETLKPGLDVLAPILRYWKFPLDELEKRRRYLSELQLSVRLSRGPKASKICRIVRRAPLPDKYLLVDALLSKSLTP